MKLETILNAFEKAVREAASSEVWIEEMTFDIEKEYSFIDRKERRANKFKERLLAVLRDTDEKNEQTYSYDAYGFLSRCAVCGKWLQLVQPGKWQCPRCG